MSIVGLLASIAVIGSLVVIILGAGKVPAMNDYTTDTKNPPMFSQKILDARKTTAMVPAEYAGPAATAMQVKAFPEIKTLSFTGSTDEVFDRALDNAKKMKWVIVDSDKAAGMIEATATTGWFGFKDDIAIRITKTATGCNFDMRSVSRVGKGDMGTNAKSIRAFLKLMGSMSNMKKLSLLFSAGAFGGLCNVLAGWLLGVLHITSGLGIQMAIHLVPDVIYRQVIWGGIWSLMFIIPVLNNKPVLKGVVLSVFPTLAALLIVIPLRAKAAASGMFVRQQAMFGLYLGVLTPLFVTVINAIWGIAAAFWLKAVEK